MNGLTFKYLLLLIGLIGAHARSSLSDSEEQEGSGEDENGIEDNGTEDGDDELDKMPEEREKPDKKAEGILIEGDVLVSDSKVRNAGANVKLWPGGIVAYEINTLKFSRESIANITKAMAEITSKTGNCIKFQEKDGERSYIKFTKDDGCYSKVGMQAIAQPLSLGTGCHQVGTMIHEILHALGVSHQHTRSDRDNYVQVNWSQIKESLKVNFKKRSNEVVAGVPYCYNSIMHYGNFAFTSNKGVKTLTSVKQASMKFGQRIRLDNCDILYLKKLYKCVGAKSGIPMAASTKSSYSRPSGSYSRTRPAVGSSPRRRLAGRK